MTRVSHVAPEAVDDPAIDELIAQVEQLEGQVPNHFRAELDFPEQFKPKLRWTMALWREGELSMPEVQHVARSRRRTAVSTAPARSVPSSRTASGPTRSTSGASWNAGRTRSTTTVCRLLEYALVANDDPGEVTDGDVEALRAAGPSDRGVVQLTHLVSDFASYNRINRALDTSYDYREVWRETAGSG